MNKIILLTGLYLLANGLIAQELENELRHMQQLLSEKEEFTIAYEITHDEDDIPLERSTAARLTRLGDEMLYEHNAITIYQTNTQQIVADHQQKRILVKNTSAEWEDNMNELKLDSELFRSLWQLKDTEARKGYNSEYLGVEGKNKFYELNTGSPWLTSVKIYIGLENKMINRIIYSFSGGEEGSGYTVAIRLIEWREENIDAGEFRESRFFTKTGSELRPSAEYRGYEIIDLNNLNN